MSRLNLVMPDINTNAIIQTVNELPTDPTGNRFVAYKISGPSTRETLYNKTIVDPSNTIATSKLLIGGNIVTIAAGGSPGDVLTLGLGQTAVFQSGGGGGGAPLPTMTQVIYVRQGGNDTTGNGTINSPYASITHAMSIINDALWEKRYLIDLGPGNWSDSFSWKAWVFIRGSTSLATRLTGIIDINDPSWAVPGTRNDQRAGGQDLNFSGTLTLNYAAVSSQYGKFYFWNCNMNNTLVITGFNPINQCVVEGGLWFGGITATGVNILWNGVSGQGGTITLNSSPTTCQFTGFGGGTVGNLTLTRVADIAPVATLIDCPVLGLVTAAGTGVSISATNSSLPVAGNISISGGSVLNRLTDAFSLGYTPSSITDWNGNSPTNVAEALNRIAAKIGPIP